MAIWTVITFNEDTGETNADPITADSAEAAIAAIADNNKYNPALLIIGAIEGAHKLIAPCEDNGKAAYACDL